MPMPAREFALLRLLAEHPQQALSREHPREQIWESYGDRTTVDTQRMRRKRCHSGKRGGNTGVLRANRSVTPNNAPAPARTYA
jgi:DNA-binding response OmpR family regulator